MPDIAQLENELNSSDPTERADALCSISARIDMGEIRVPGEKNEVNLHYHTFFSYNSEGWSPSRIAWEAKKYGLSIAGIVDFDVLDGMEEFLAAGEIIDLRTTVAVESRVFIREYAGQAIHSPKEPGVSCFMAAGCFKIPEEGSHTSRLLQNMRVLASRRNIQMLERINLHLGKIQLDYEADVLPLTPSGNAAEHHIFAACDAKARQVFGDNNNALAEFWAKTLEIAKDDVEVILRDTPKLHNMMRNKLMNYDGAEDVESTTDTFPPIEQMIEMAQGMHALPMAVYLDGTNPGESDILKLLSLMESKGAVAMNIAPERNWNINNPSEKIVKLDNLAAAIRAARKIDFPICVGTEMNEAGLPFVDNFHAPELAPYIDDFIKGAYFLWGHTFLSRAADMGFASEWARAHFGNDRPAKNDFYERIGRLASAKKIRMVASGANLRTASPNEVLRLLQV
ncbi:MAG: hypothetical protein ABFD49_08635 [Armatimonadota bacterium]|nr:hypothetical protein [bacterium]